MIYTYHGREGDRPPEDTTEVIFHPSVIIIQEEAFYGCTSLVRITIPDTVTRIEGAAFNSCLSLKSIRLPRNLEWIGELAFAACSSLEALFLPPTVTHIGDWAFAYCTSLRYFYVPGPINDIGELVFQGCDRLLATININVNLEEYVYDNEEVIRRSLQQHANLPFHKACSSTDITPLTIEACLQEHEIERATEVDNQQMAALHILCANPHVTGDDIRAYLTLTREAADMHGIECAEGVHEDHVTALHILCSNQFVTGDAIRAYLQLIPEAAEKVDSEGMTPFQYLCENGVNFGADRSFSSLMALWYSCMP